jgi:uncharacterized protein involved in exopolysaccharide biosynthesis
MPKFDQQSESSGFGERLLRQSPVIVAATLTGLLLAIVYLNLATYRYRAELRVTPSAASKTPALALGGGNVGGLASLAGISLGAAASATPFDLYMDAILSREVAEHLARDPLVMRAVFAADWDVSGKRWRDPYTGLGNAVRSLKSLMGIPVRPWQKPDAAALQKHLERSLKVYKNNTVPITRIQYDHRDGYFAAYLLTRMNDIADRKVRRDALDQARVYTTYLSKRLPEVTIAELRSRIVDQLSKQEELTMMASSAVPYAAVPLEEPTVPDLPDNPRPRIVLPLGVLAGVAIGVLLALLRSSRWRRNRGEVQELRESSIID